MTATPQEVVAEMHADLLDLGREVGDDLLAGYRREFARAIRGLGSRDDGWVDEARTAAAIALAAAVVAAANRSRSRLLAAAPSVARVAARRQVALVSGLDAQILGAPRPLRFGAGDWAKERGLVLGRARVEAVRASLSRLDRELASRLEREILTANLAGKSWSEGLAVLRSAASSSLSAESWRLRTLARTEVSELYNGTLLAAIEAEDTEESPMKKRLSATFDNLTGIDSIGVHNQVRRVGEPFEDGNGRRYQAPPNRPNDREVVLPHRASWGAVLPPLGGPREPGRVIAEEGSPETLAAASALTRATSDLRDTIRMAEASLIPGGLVQLARARVREGQVVLAANRARDRRYAGLGARARAGAFLSFGGVGGRVVKVGGGYAEVVVAGARLRLPTERGLVLGASRGRGMVTTTAASGRMAASMIAAVLG